MKNIELGRIKRMKTNEAEIVRACDIIIFYQQKVLKVEMKQMK